MISPSLIIDRPEHQMASNIDNEVMYGDLQKAKPCLVMEDLKYPNEVFDKAWPYRRSFGPDRASCKISTPPKSHESTSSKLPWTSAKRRDEKKDDDSLAVFRSHSRRTSKAGSDRSNELTIGYASVEPYSSYAQHATLFNLLQLVRSNAEQSRELSGLLERLLSQSAHDPYDQEFINRDSPRPFIKPIREQPEDPGPKIAVAGGDSPSPPRDTRFFGQGHMVDRADVNAEKDSASANNDETPPTSALASASHSPAPGSDIVACPMMAFSEPSGHYAETRNELDVPPGDFAVRSYHSQDPPKRFETYAPYKHVNGRDLPVRSREQPLCDCARKMGHVGSPKYFCPGYANRHVCPVNAGARCQHIGGNSCFSCRRKKAAKASKTERAKKERVHKKSRRPTRGRGENKKSDMSSLELSSSFVEH
ncbi:hypothetical protein KEM56_007379, partial [Ascosphaera pollenicola]